MVEDHPVDRARRLLEAFGNELRATRTSLDLTLRELADIVGINAPALARIENAMLVPTPAQLEILRGWLLQQRCQPV